MEIRLITRINISSYAVCAYICTFFKKCFGWIWFFYLWIITPDKEPNSFSSFASGKTSDQQNDWEHTNKSLTEFSQSDSEKHQIKIEHMEIDETIKKEKRTKQNKRRFKNSELNGLKFKKENLKQVEILRHLRIVTEHNSDLTERYRKTQVLDTLLKTDITKWLEVQDAREIDQTTVQLLATISYIILEKNQNSEYYDSSATTAITRNLLHEKGKKYGEKSMPKSKIERTDFGANVSQEKGNHIEELLLAINKSFNDNDDTDETQSQESFSIKSTKSDDSGYVSQEKEEEDTNCEEYQNSSDYDETDEAQSQEEISNQSNILDNASQEEEEEDNNCEENQNSKDYDDTDETESQKKLPNRSIISDGTETVTLEEENRHGEDQNSKINDGTNETTFQEQREIQSVTSDDKETASQETENYLKQVINNVDKSIQTFIDPLLINEDIYDQAELISYLHNIQTNVKLIKTKLKEDLLQLDEKAYNYPRRSKMNSKVPRKSKHLDIIKDIQLRLSLTLKDVEESLSKISVDIPWEPTFDNILPTVRQVTEKARELGEYFRRLNSFLLGENQHNRIWNNGGSVWPGPLAAAGFSYDGEGDIVVCRQCGKKSNTQEWENNDEEYAFAMHRRKGEKEIKNCPFLRTFDIRRV